LADVLSQREIDELLSALASGKVDPKTEKQEEPLKIKKYDFKSANKFPKEQIKTLNIIFDNFSILLQAFLSGTLGTYCEVNVISVEEQTYYEFTNSFPSPVILAIIEMKPLEGLTLFEISPATAYAILSRLFGGSGSESDTNRIFTEVDLTIIEKVIRQFVPLLNEAWAKIYKIDARLDRIETSSQFAQIVSNNETIAIITFSIKIDEVEGLCNFCIPHLTIEPIAKNLNTKYASAWVSTKKNIESNSESIRRRILNTQLNLNAVLSETNVLVSDIANLQVGDVIQLDSKIQDPIKIKIEHMPKIFGTLGVKNNRYAIKITDIVKEEDIFYE